MCWQNVAEASCTSSRCHQDGCGYCNHKQQAEGQRRCDQGPRTEADPNGCRSCSSGRVGKKLKENLIQMIFMALRSYWGLKDVALFNTHETILLDNGNPLTILMSLCLSVRVCVTWSKNFSAISR